MLSKKYIMNHIDNLYEEVNSLNLRLYALERQNMKKDFKKLSGKRGPGRPRKETKDGAKK